MFNIIVRHINQLYSLSEQMLFSMGRFVILYIFLQKGFNTFIKIFLFNFLVNLIRDVFVNQSQHNFYKNNY